MLLEFKFLMVYEPWLIIFHHEEKGIYFSTGSAADAQTVIYIWYQKVFP